MTIGFISASEVVECEFVLPVPSRYCVHIRLLASSSACQMLASLQSWWLSVLRHKKYEKDLIVYCKKAGKQILYIYKFSFLTDFCFIWNRYEQSSSYQYWGNKKTKGPCSIQLSIPGDVSGYGLVGSPPSVFSKISFKFSNFLTLWKYFFSFRPSRECVTI